MKALLVATDFSTAAFNAAKYAAEMAIAIKADMLLLYVYQLPVVYTEIPVALNVEKEIHHAERELGELRKVLMTKTGGHFNIETKVVTGDFFQQLKSVCELTNPYAVVMGSQGTSAADRLLFGNHTIYAMRHLAWPLITVPPKATFSSIKRVALACDYNKIADTVPLEEVELLVRQLNAELHILNVGKREDFNTEIVFQSRVLQDNLKVLKATQHFLTNENTGNAIIDFTESKHIDLLIVVPKHHGLLDTIVHKSQSKKLLLHSHVPVMVLHHQ